MRFITCASYYGTGSSAIIDIISEFNGVFPYANTEYRFIQDPDGISELEFNLVECFNRHNSGHALKRYKRLVDFYSGNIFGKKYSEYFGDKWKTISYQYIDSLTDFTFPGGWLYDLYDKGIFYYYINRIINKMLQKTIWRNNPERSYSLKNEITYCSHPSEEEFLILTRKYIYNLFSSIVPEGKDIILVDQLLPPTNIERYLRYFENNIQTVVVDRDPRDVYVLDKYFWKDGRVPCDPETFCKWYRYTREHRKTENLDTCQIKLIQFEDLIFHYDSTLNSLIEWLGLKKENHTMPKQRFDPNKSINNTQTWKKVPACFNEIKTIEQQLKDYLYPFPEGELVIIND